MNRPVLLGIAGFALVAAVGFWLIPGGGNDWPIKNDRPAGDVLVALGDSLTYGQGAGLNESYPEHLAELVGRPVINEGVNGNTTADALRRIKSITAKKPAIVFITLGGNDILRRLPVETTRDNLQQIFRKLHATGAMVVYGAVNPPLISGKRTKAIKELCRKEGVLYIESIMQGLWNDTELMSDTIHPNGDGYRILAERFHTRIAGHYSHVSE